MRVCCVVSVAGGQEETEGDSGGRGAAAEDPAAAGLRHARGLHQSGSESGRAVHIRRRSAATSIAIANSFVVHWLLPVLTTPGNPPVATTKFVITEKATAVSKRNRKTSGMRSKITEKLLV